MVITRIRRPCRRCRLVYICYTVIGCVVLYPLIIKRHNEVELVDYESMYRRNDVNNTSHPDKSVSKQVCVHPKLDGTYLAKFLSPAPSVVCNNEPDWVTVKNSVVTINPYVKEKYGDFSCEIRYIIRHDNDFETSLSRPVNLNFESKLILEHDFFTCRCVTKVNILKRRYKTYIYENVHAGIANKNEVKMRQPNIGSGLGLNVLMLGFDSVSQIAYKIKLKDTFKYFTETLKGIVLNGYNIVGDGTPQALIPILTGKTELELPSTLKHNLPKTYVDVYPMVWKHFRKKGYVTAFGEDMANLGVFTYRMNGFKEQPTDHFHRPFQMESEKYHWKFPELCLGSRKRSEVFFDWYRQFFIQYRNQPKFAFGFYSELSHNDLNLLETADYDLLSTLKFLNEEGYLNNTILILMSDHGPRFSSLRASLQGKQGERRPFAGFAFPKWFDEKYPKIIQSMKINSKRLATPFDIYNTLMDILTYNDSAVNNINHRGMSLFKEIPETRSCYHAQIDAHWCACLEWIPIQSDNTNVLKAAESLVKHINSLTQSHRKLCAKLNIYKISKASFLLPKHNMLKFKGSKDINGRIPDLSDKTRISEVAYQIWIQTTPGDGLFEATITHKRKQNKFQVRTEDISRINRYGSAPKCIEKQHEELRKYCYCK